MPQLDLTFVYWLILIVFTTAAVIRTIVTISNVVRLRNIRLHWKTGKLYGYPLFSTIFLCFTTIAAIIAYSQGATQELLAAGLSCCLSLCWFTTSYYSTKRFITDYGIVKNVNEPVQTVAWHQIRDFVEKTNDSSTRFIFIYAATHSSSCKDLVRLELVVPENRREPFQRLINHKLGRRIRCYVDEEINVEPFDK